MPKTATTLPSLELLLSPPAVSSLDTALLMQRLAALEACLATYAIVGRVVAVEQGPVFTLIKLELSPGVRASQISRIRSELAHSLSASAIRIIDVIPGTPYLGIEMVNDKRDKVYLRELIESRSFQEKVSSLMVALGKDATGQPVVIDLAKAPHLLIAGTTGSGKSMCVHSILLSLLYRATQEEVRFILIDPIGLEFSHYAFLPHLLTPVISDMREAVDVINWCIRERERRYRLMDALSVSTVERYNQRIEEAETMGFPLRDPFSLSYDTDDTQPPTLKKMPYLLVVIDGLADLIMEDNDDLLDKLALKGAVVGIHLILTTKNIWNKSLMNRVKFDIPSRIALRLTNKSESIAILDQSGAEALMGDGDLFYLPPHSNSPLRLQGTFVHDQEIREVAQYWSQFRTKQLNDITDTISQKTRQPIDE